MVEVVKRDKFTEMTEKIIDQIKEGVAPWQRKWTGGISFMPMNPTTGNSYRGVNTIFLLMAAYNDPRWMTYRQALSVGAQVKRGERGTPILFWKMADEKIVRDEDGKPKVDNLDRLEKEEVQYQRPMAIWSTVFNAEQIDGLPPLIEKDYKEPTWESLERAERALQESGVTIDEIEGSDSAFYSKSKDRVTLPARGQFNLAAQFYQTALHEVSHATGHESRLNRDLTGKFGDHSYAREELIAELSSLFLGMETGTGFTPNDQVNSAAYVEHWSSLLRENVNEIFKASTKAKQACQYIMDRVREYEKKHGIEFEMEDTLEIIEKVKEAEPEQINEGQDQAGKDRTYISVPFREKNEAKALGAKWDIKLLSWYVPDGIDLKPFEKWLHHATRASLYEDKKYGPDQASSEKKGQTNDGLNRIAEERVYLKVLYQDRSEVEALGARFDNMLSNWYIPAGMDVKPFAKWFHAFETYKAEKNEQKAGWNEMYPNDPIRAEMQWITSNCVYEGFRVRSAEEILKATNLGRETKAYLLFKPFRKFLDEVTSIGEEIKSELLSNDEYSIEGESHRHFINDWEEFAKILDSFSRDLDDNYQQQSEWTARQPGGDDSLTIAAAETQGRYTDQEIDEAAEISRINSNGPTMKPDKSNGEEKAIEFRTYLAVPFAEKDQARNLGAKWSPNVKMWYFEEGIALENKEKLLEQYSLGKTVTKHEPLEKILPEKEFAQELEKIGCDLSSGHHPIMNGQRQRIRVQGDKGAERSGFYIAYQDGRPNAYFKNNRTGEELRWKSQENQQVQTEQQKQALAENYQKRQKEIAETRQDNELKTQAQIQNNLKSWKPALEAEYTSGNYYEQKGITPTPGTFQTKYGDICVPAMDMDGNVWTAQYIKADGSAKMFASEGRLSGMFHPVGADGPNALDKADAIIIAEGYATACTIQEATEKPVIVAFNAAGLKAIAGQFRDKYPDKPILIAGDDDKHLLKNPQVKMNVGADKAKEAAEAVNGAAIIPKFAPGEQRKDAKAYTDFNDLGKRSTLGMTGVKKQIEAGLVKAMKLVKENSQEQAKIKTQDVAVITER